MALVVRSHATCASTASLTRMPSCAMPARSRSRRACSVSCHEFFTRSPFSSRNDALISSVVAWANILLMVYCWYPSFPKYKAVICSAILSFSSCMDSVCFTDASYVAFCAFAISSSTFFSSFCLSISASVSRSRLILPSAVSSWASVRMMLEFVRSASSFISILSASVSLPLLSSARVSERIFSSIELTSLMYWSSCFLSSAACSLAAFSAALVASASALRAASRASILPLTSSAALPLSSITPVVFLRSAMRSRSLEPRVCVLQVASRSSFRLWVMDAWARVDASMVFMAPAKSPCTAWSIAVVTLVNFSPTLAKTPRMVRPVLLTTVARPLITSIREVMPVMRLGVQSVMVPSLLSVDISPLSPPVLLATSMNAWLASSSAGVMPLARSFFQRSASLRMRVRLSPKASAMAACVFLRATS